MTSQKLRCVAIDDEPLALDIISKFCERFGGIELSAYSDPAEGIEVIKKGDFDLAFLDVEMEGINGLEIAAAVPPEACFIFTTAYLDYAFDGFNLNAVDYLHKPFAYDRFKLAVEKAIKKLDYNEHVQADKCIVVKQEYNNVSIPLADIAYVEAMEGYSKIFRTDGSCTLSRDTQDNRSDASPEEVSEDSPLVYSGCRQDPQFQPSERHPDRRPDHSGGASVQRSALGASAESEVEFRIRRAGRVAAGQGSRL